MPLEIKVNTTKATKATTDLKTAFDGLANKIEQIKTAFSQIRIKQFDEAKEGITSLKKALEDTKSQVASLKTQNEALQKQLDLMVKAKTVTEELTGAKNKSKNATKDETTAETELEKIKKKALVSTARLAAMTEQESEAYRKAVKEIEKDKIVTDNLSTTQKKAALAADDLITKMARQADTIKEVNSAHRAALVEERARQAQMRQGVTTVQELTQAHRAALLEERARQVQMRQGTTTLQELTQAHKAALLEERARQVQLRQGLFTQQEINAAHKAALFEDRKRTIQIRDSTVATDQSTASTKKNTVTVRNNTSAVSEATAKNRELGISISQGNKYAAAFRAGLSAVGGGFGIFTGSTIVAAASVYGFVRAMRATVEAGTEFEFTMDRVNAVMNTTSAESSALEERVRTLAETTIFTAGEVSKGLVFLGMAGFQVNEAMEALEPTLRLAQIGMIDMERAADLVTNIMAGFNIQAIDIAETVDKLSVVVTSSNVSITQLAQSLSLVGPAAANTNTTLEETTAIIGFFGNVGIKATRAGTALRRGIANLSNPTDKVAKTMADLGILITDTDGRMRSMADIISDLSSAGAGMSDIFEIFGTRAGPAFAAAIISGTDEIRDLVEAQKDVTGTSKALANVLQDNAYTDFKLVISAAEETFISLYKTMDGPLRKALQGLASLLRGIAPLMTGVAAVLGVLTIGVGALATAWLSLKILGVIPYLGQMAAAAVAARFPIQAIGSAALGSSASLGVLKAAMGFLLTPLGLVTAGLTVLAVAYITSTSESERFNKSLKEQSDLLDDLSKLRLTSGLSDSKEAKDGVLGKALEQLEKINNSKGPTIGKQLAKDFDKALDGIEKADERLARYQLRADTEKLNSGRVSDRTAKFLEQAEAGVITANRVYDAVKLTESAFNEIGKTLDEINVKDLTNLQLKKILNDRQREITKNAKEEARVKRIREIADQKLTTVLQKNLSIEKLINGESENSLKNREKQRKFELSSAFKSFKAGTGDPESKKEIEKLLKERKADLAILEAKAEGLASNYVDVIAAFRDSDAVKLSEFRSDLDDEETYKAIEKSFEEFRALKQVQINDLNKLDVETQKNFLDASIFAYDREIAVIKTKGEEKLNAQKKISDRETSKLEFDLSVRRISIQQYVDGAAESYNKLVEVRKTTLREQIAATTSEVASNIAIRDGLVGNKTAGDSYTETIRKQTLRIAELNDQLRVLKSTEKSTADTQEDYSNIIRGIIANVDKANVKLQEQNDVMQRGKDVVRNHTQQVGYAALEELELKIAANEATEAQKGLAEELRKGLLEYDATRDKSNEIEEAWSDAFLDMKGKAKSSAESMHDAFVTFFTDPSKDALDDLLRHFSMIIQKMLAEQLASELFSSKGGGLGDLFTNLFNFGGSSASSSNVTSAITAQDLGSSLNGVNLFGNNATGGSYTVRGSGGIDSSLVQFMATPGERVTVSNPNGGDDSRDSRMSGDNVTFNNVINIDGSGSNKEETRAMINQSMSALEAKMIRQQQRQQKPLGIR